MLITISLHVSVCVCWCVAMQYVALFLVIITIFIFPSLPIGFANNTQSSAYNILLSFCVCVNVLLQYSMLHYFCWLLLRLFLCLSIGFPVNTQSLAYILLNICTCKFCYKNGKHDNTSPWCITHKPFDHSNQTLSLVFIDWQCCLRRHCVVGLSHRYIQSLPKV